MSLNRYKLGELITQRREKYDQRETLPIRGVSREGFINPKQNEADTSLYNVFYKYDFVFNPARMEINSIALNVELDKGVCSSLYEIFYISREDIMLPQYLNMYIKRNEFARLCEFIGWGSAREYCRIADISDIDIDLPPIEIQQKYVDVYNAMVANQKAYEQGLDDLKLTCDAYIENVMKSSKQVKLGKYITRHDVRNGKNGTKNVKGISTSKEFRNPTSKVNKNELENYKVVKPRQIGFVQTTHNEKVFAYAFNSTRDNIVVSSVNEVFSCDEQYLMPEFLSMIFNRKEFDRYARFHSWGSARETFTWDDLVEVNIPVLSLDEQKSISNIYIAYKNRKSINEKLKQQIKNICPILIKGSIEEAMS